MKNIRVYAVLLVLATATAAVVFAWPLYPDKPEISPTPSMEALLPPGRGITDPDVVHNRDDLYQFIAGKLTGPYGIYTNMTDTDQFEELAAGHEVLSESSSLLLRYLALTKQKDAFAKVWAQARKTFDSASGFSYRYSPQSGKKYPVNAAVDDLRFIRALYEAGVTLNDPDLTKEADRLGRRFYKYNVKNGRVYDFYDETYKTTNSFITLCYVDLQVLKRLSIPAGQRKALVANMEKIATNGYISDLFPFYRTRYNYDSGKYESESIHTVESLLTILALAEIHKQKETSIRYIKKHVQEGTLYGAYSPAGKPLNDIQSAAVYAIAAMIGSVTKDESLYRDSLRRMNAFRVTDEDDAMYGGFGDAAAGQAYSFDNLMALLAYTY